MKNLKTVNSVVLIIAFFLPWIDMIFISWNGYELVKGISNLYRTISFFSGNSDNQYLYFSYAFFLIPILAFVNIIFDLTKTKRLGFLNEFFVGLILTLSLPILFIAKGGNIEVFFKFPGFGYYLTFIFSITGIILSFIKGTENNKINSESNYSNLKSMLDRDVITEKIFIEETDRLFQQKEQKKDQKFSIETLISNSSNSTYITAVIFILMLIFGICISLS